MDAAPAPVADTPSKLETMAQDKKKAAALAGVRKIKR